MTPEELHEYNRTHAIGGISYEAVVRDDAVLEFRLWIEEWLRMAYEAGYRNAKKGEL